MSVLVEKEEEIVESLLLSEVEFCVVDLETTGGSSEYNSITEIGAVKYRAGEEVGRFTTLVNPGCAIPPFIVLLTGITDTMVTNAPAIEGVLDDLLEFIGDAVLVAHNARFDIGFINAALVNDGREKLANRVLDTVGLARRLVGGEVENCKLSTLAASLGFAHQPSHRAINDVTIENGCPQIISGLHKHGTLSHYFVPTLGYECFENPPSTPIVAEIKAGGAVFFSSLTPHLTGPNSSNSVRKAYIVQYARHDAVVLEGNSTDGAPTGSHAIASEPRGIAVLKSGQICAN